MWDGQHSDDGTAFSLVVQRQKVKLQLRDAIRSTKIGRVMFGTICWSLVVSGIAILLGAYAEVSWGPYALYGLALWVFGGGVVGVFFTVMILPWCLFVRELIRG